MFTALGGNEIVSITGRFVSVTVTPSSLTMPPRTVLAEMVIVSLVLPFGSTRTVNSVPDVPGALLSLYSVPS